MIRSNGRVLCRCVALALAGFAASVQAAEYHVAVTGKDDNAGTAAAPLKTIAAAAAKAQPGDTVTVHAGTYRERVNPPRGGTDDAHRITYQAAPGEKVEIKGSEIVTGWKKLQHDTWQVTLPNTFFGKFNPYADLIHGDWFNGKGRQHHSGAVYLNGDCLLEAKSVEDVLQPAGPTPQWFGKVEGDTTTLWAQFPGVNPNEKTVEINVRQTVFYPDQPGRGFITVRGFTLRHAATPWAPPTAEQLGLIGTHWSRGWIIENNVISHSRCSGVALGKYGDEFDNKSESADAYNRTVKRAIENGWSRDKIGHHIVRHNTISHCEQTGVVGSLGCAFSTVTDNTIHDIHVHRLFTGAEMAGIKFHGAIDVEIRRNHIHHTTRGIWLDWMAQGTRVSGNLLHDNRDDDLFMEVDHGPFVIDNNIFLSPRTLLDVSHGGAYVHNLIAGKVALAIKDNRQTPYHEAHSTTLAGLHDNPSGDDRFYNNLLVAKADLSPYDKALQPLFLDGNLFATGTKPCQAEKFASARVEFDPDLRLVSEGDQWALELTLDPAWAKGATRQAVTTELLGRTAVAKLPYENRDGSPLKLDRDFLNQARPAENPLPGPFGTWKTGPQKIPVWPLPQLKE